MSSVYCCKIPLLLRFFIVWCMLYSVQATKKATCNSWTLKAPPVGDFKCNPLGVTVSMPGTRCMLECDAGYRPQHEVLVCSEDGGWIPTNTPECLADSTMTLVIVLSIGGSIILIVSLSVLYATTSKRCRGSRRKLEEEDQEAAPRRKEITDTSAYYGRVKRLRYKRRLQAERQRQRAAKLVQSDKPVSKQPVNARKKEDSKRAKVSQSSPNRKKTVVDNIKTKVATPKPKQKQIQPKKNFSETIRDMFCSSCYSKHNSRNKSEKKLVPALKPKENETKIFSISEDPAIKKDSSSSSSDSATTSSLSCSSSSSDSSSEDEKVDVKPAEEKVEGKVDNNITKVDETETPCSRAVKPPKKPPPPTIRKKPPPRPPAPKLKAEKVVARRKSSPIDTENDSGGQHNRRNSSEAALRGQHRGPKVISSGYSSEDERHRRNQGHKSHKNSNNPHKVSNSHGPVMLSASKRMEIMSPMKDAKPPVNTGNPYENYPAALSYRQYQNFENDYRRTTGEYHPQYINVELIPIQPVKRGNEKKDAEKTKEKGDDDTTEAKDATSACAKGGVKYICINEKDGEEDEAASGDSPARRKLDRRYEDPAERDKRRQSPDSDNRRRAPKYEARKMQKRSKSEVRRLQIEDEMIIDNGITKKGNGRKR